MRRKARPVLMTVALLALTCGAAGGGNNPTKLRRAPSFALSDWQGKRVSLAEFRGRVVLLQFFQTGCPICQREAPILEDLYRKLKDKGLVVMGVSHDAGGAEAVKEFARRFDLTYFLLLGDLEIAVRYIGITPQQSAFDVPRFFLIDREGYIVKDIDAAHDPDFLLHEKSALEKAIQEALSRPAESHLAASRI